MSLGLSLSSKQAATLLARGIAIVIVEKRQQQQHQ